MFGYILRQEILCRSKIARGIAGHYPPLCCSNVELRVEPERVVEYILVVICASPASHPTVASWQIRQRQQNVHDVHSTDNLATGKLRVPLTAAARAKLAVFRSLHLMVFPAVYDPQVQYVLDTTHNSQTSTQLHRATNRINQGDKWTQRNRFPPFDTVTHHVCHRRKALRE